MGNKNHENTVLIDRMMFFVKMLVESADLGFSKAIMLCLHPDALLIGRFFLYNQGFGVSTVSQDARGWG